MFIWRACTCWLNWLAQPLPMYPLCKASTYQKMVHHAKQRVELRESGFSTKKSESSARNAQKLQSLPHFPCIKKNWEHFALPHSKAASQRMTLSAGWKKFPHAHEGLRSAFSSTCSITIRCSLKKIRSDSFLTDVVHLWAVWYSEHRIHVAQHSQEENTFSWCFVIHCNVIARVVNDGGL